MHECQALLARWRRGAVADRTAFSASWMRLIPAGGAIAYCLLSTGCAYLGHRVRDLTDIVTLAAETGEVACVARFTVPYGISYADNGRGFGLREGHMGS